MSKPRKLKRREAEALASLFGCRIGQKPIYDEEGIFQTWGEETYIFCAATGKEELVDLVHPQGQDFCYWTNHDWTKAFQRVSGISCADLWSRPKPKP